MARLFLSLILVAGPLACQAFLPPTPLVFRPSRTTSARRGSGALKAMLDPTEVVGLVNSHVDSQWLLSTLQGVADAALDAAASDPAVEAAQTAAANSGGPLGAVTNVIENSIAFIHETLQGFGMENTYGLAIIGFTILIKVVTLPLNYKQIESTTKMQMIQPKMKELQAKYKNDPQMQQQKLTELYQDNDVNPLAGCLPALVQIPIFISLYRALTNLANANELNEAFLWLPNLEGPTYGAAPAEGMSWLTKGWETGAPPLGWHDTIAFLTIPLILVVSQFVSQALLQPQSAKDDPTQQQSQVILKFLPFMVGYFSLNVPSGLGVYWIANNLITTITTVAVRAVIASKDGAAVASQGSTMASKGVVTDVVDEGKKRGFGKAPPPAPKVEEEDEPDDSEDAGPKRAAPVATLPEAERTGRTARNSVVEVVKQEGGMTLLREVKDGEVISTTVRLTPEEMRRRKERADAIARGEDPDAVDETTKQSGKAKPSTDAPGLGRNKRRKRSKK